MRRMNRQEANVGDEKLAYQKARGAFNAMLVRAMRRDGIKEITHWADHHGVGRSTLYAIMRGRETASGTWVMPSMATAVKLAEALGVPLHELIYVLIPDAPGARHAPSESTDVFRPSPVTRVLVEVAGWVGAGPDQYEEIDGQSVYVESAFARGKKLRAFRVRGDSMAAGRHPIVDGDIVIVDTTDPGQNTDAVVARLHNDAYVCKMLKDDRFGKLLQSRNVEHTNGTPSAIPVDEVAEIVGRVVRVIHDE